jgi:hypothetical protein
MADIPTVCAAVCTQPLSASAAMKSTCRCGDQPSERGLRRTGTHL